MRVKNAAINSIFSFVQKIVETVLSFIYRTIFIQILGVTYLGVNGLFTNIFSVLSLMELGVGSSIIFLLYKPLAQKQTEKIKTFMKFYSSMYRGIALGIFVIGMMLIPFLPYIVKSEVEIPDLVPIYILMLLNTVSSYLFAYKRSILEADQKAYYNSINYSIFNIINTVARLIVLVITKNFLLCLAVQIIVSLLSNIEISLRVNKMYPYLKEKNVKKLDKRHLKIIISRMKAIMMHKIGNIAITSTDNIIISSFINVAVTGIYSNYSMITNIIYTTVSLIFVSITASVGNLKVTETREQSEKIFNRLLFINYFFYFVICVTSLCMFNDFILTWLGEDFVFSPLIVFLIVMQLYVTGMRHTPVTFINSSGLNYNSRFKPLAEAVINLVVSIIGVKLWGIAGVILGTIVAYVSCSVWIEPVILYKHWFKKSPVKYFIKYFGYLILMLIVAFGVNKICSLITLSGWLNVIVKFVMAVVLSTIIFIVCFFKTDEFKYYLDIIKMTKNAVIEKIKRRSSNNGERIN